MTFQTLGTLFGLMMALGSAVASLYLWLVRLNRERPALKTFAVSAFDWDSDHGRRAHRLLHFATPPEGDAWNCQYLLFEAEVHNLSLRPNAVRAVRAALLRQDGGWEPFAAAFAPGPSDPDGPFVRHKVRSKNSQAGAIEVAKPKTKLERGVRLPAPGRVRLGPGESTKMQFVLWQAVSTEGWPDAGFWDRAAVDGKRGRELVMGPLATPLTIRLELDAEHGGTFADDLTPDQTARPIVRMTDLPMELSVKIDPPPTDEIARYMSALPAALERVARTDGDLDPVVYAAVLHRLTGAPLPHPGPTAAWLIGRQERDGGWPGDSAQSRLYATGMALTGLYALGRPPRRDPLPALEAAAREVSGTPDWPTHLGPLTARAYRLCGRPMPADLVAALSDRLSRPPEDEYLFLTAAFDAVSFARLLGRPPADAEKVLDAVLAEHGEHKLKPSYREHSNEHCWFAVAYLLRVLGAGNADAELMLSVWAAKGWENHQKHWRADDGFRDDSTARQMAETVAALALCGVIAPVDAAAAELMGFGIAPSAAIARAA